ncbi:MAG: hypothetical protein U1E46_15975 [Hyphomicrobiales bacterium]
MNRALLAFVVGSALAASGSVSAHASTCKVSGKRVECTSSAKLSAASSVGLGSLSFSNTTASSAIAKVASSKSVSTKRASKGSKQKNAFTSVGLSIPKIVTSNPNPTITKTTFVRQQEIVANPIPPAALLFGTALLGIGFIARRRNPSPAVG